MIRLITDDQYWVPLAVGLALAALIRFLILARREHRPALLTATSAAHLFLGLAVGVLGIGHVLAVSIKGALGTLSASTNLWFAIPYGAAFGATAFLLAAQGVALAGGRTKTWYWCLGLNLGLGALLMIPARHLMLFVALNLVLLWRLRRRVS